MKKLLLLFTLFTATAHSQYLESKDSCVTGIPLETFFHATPLLMGYWPDDEFRLFINQKEFEKYFKRSDRQIRDSIVAGIDFSQNNAIIFTLIEGGCGYPVVGAEYYSGGYLQVKINGNGRCAMKITVREYMIVPKRIPIPSKINVCRIYP